MCCKCEMFLNNTDKSGQMLPVKRSDKQLHESFLCLFDKKEKKNPVVCVCVCTSAKRKQRGCLGPLIHSCCVCVCVSVWHGAERLSVHKVHLSHHRLKALTSTCKAITGQYPAFSPSSLISWLFINFYPPAVIADWNISTL